MGINSGPRKEKVVSQARWVISAVWGLCCGSGSVVGSVVGPIYVYGRTR